MWTLCQRGERLSQVYGGVYSKRPDRPDPEGMGRLHLRQGQRPFPAAPGTIGKMH